MGWMDAHEPWFEQDGFVDMLLNHISILDVLELLGVEAVPSATGTFTHKARCPLPVHNLNGEETVASLFICENENSYKCFGCQSSGNLINLVCQYYGIPFYKAVEILAKKYGLMEGEVDANFKKRRKPSKNKLVSTYIYKTGVVARDYLKFIKGKKEYDKWCNWIDKILPSLDGYMDKLDEERDWEIAKNYYESITKIIKGS